MFKFLFKSIVLAVPIAGLMLLGGQLSLASPEYAGVMKFVYSGWNPHYAVVGTLTFAYVLVGVIAALALILISQIWWSGAADRAAASAAKKAKAAERAQNLVCRKMRPEVDAWITWLNSVRAESEITEIAKILRRKYGVDGGVPERATITNDAIASWLLTVGAEFAERADDNGRSTEFLYKAIDHAAQSDNWTQIAHAKQGLWTLIAPILRDQYIELHHKNANDKHFDRVAVRLVVESWITPATAAGTVAPATPATNP